MKTLDNSPYQQRLEQRSRSGFIVLIIAVTAALCLMVMSALFYQVRQKPKRAVEHSPKPHSTTLFAEGPPSDGWSVFFDERPEGSTDVCYTSGGVWRIIARKAPHHPWKVLDSVLWRRWWDTLRLVKVIRQNEAVLRLREKEDSL